MNVPSSAPCFDSVSSSGKASKRMDDDSYKSAQLADLGELERANQSVDSWRRVASVEAIAIVAMVGLCAMLGSRPLQPPVVYHESANGLVLHRMEALASLATDNPTTIAAVQNYVMAWREIPGTYIDQAKQNLALIDAMTVNEAQYNARTVAIAHFNDPENNPEQLGMNGVTRTPSNVSCVPLTVFDNQAESFVCTWSETESKKTGDAPISTPQHSGRITIRAKPHVQNNPNNPDAVSLNPGGVEVIQSDLR
jgi:hypothetical protein